MDDALLVGSLEGLGDLLRDGQRLIEGDRALRDAIGQGRALELFRKKPTGRTLLDWPPSDS